MVQFNKDNESQNSQPREIYQKISESTESIQISIRVTRKNDNTRWSERATRRPQRILQNSH